MAHNSTRGRTEKGFLFQGKFQPAVGRELDEEIKQTDGTLGLQASVNEVMKHSLNFSLDPCSWKHWDYWEGAYFILSFETVFSREKSVTLL